MIKKISLLVLLSLSAFILNAQSDFKPEWNFGAGFGPTFSSVSFDSPSRDRIETKNMQAFHGGIAARYISEKHLGIIAELNYSQQGWEGKYRDEQANFEHSHSLTYLELPVMTHIYFGRKVRFFVNLGPKIQFLIGEKEKMNEALANYLANNDIQQPNPYNKDAKFKFDYGIIGGLGLEFRSKMGNFTLEGRYYAGFGDIFENKAREENFTRSANRVISAKITYYTKIF